MIQKHIDQYTIRVLVSREDGEFAARALELDLVGYGETEDEAVNELLQMIDCQMSFARQKGDEAMIVFPAPKQFFDRWETAHAIALKRGVLGKGDKSIKLDYEAVTVTLDLKKLSQRKREFVREQVLA